MCDLHPGRLQRLQPVPGAHVIWQPHARRLAAEVTHPASRWRPLVEAVPRHVFVPRWWTSHSAGPDGWASWDLNDGPADEHAWLDAEASTVHQGGPRRLWDHLDDVRHTWLRNGFLPLHGATATITPGGAIHLQRGRWQATIT